jgi:hypothetical protein
MFSKLFSKIKNFMPKTQNHAHLDESNSIINFEDYDKLNNDEFNNAYYYVDIEYIEGNNKYKIRPSK